jgi:hypothetical protein
MAMPIPNHRGQSRQWQRAAPGASKQPLGKLHIMSTCNSCCSEGRKPKQRANKEAKYSLRKGQKWGFSQHFILGDRFQFRRVSFKE